MNDSMKTGVKKFTLFLMTQKGYFFLKHMIKNHREFIGIIVVGCDTNINNDFSIDIIKLCEKNELPWTNRVNFSNISTEYAVTVSWRWFIEAPIDRLIIFHDSILPKYRGFAPLVNSLINGEKKIGVTALFGGNEYDCGPIIAQSYTQIDYPLTISEAITRNNENYLNCIDIICDTMKSEELLIGTIQDATEASYSVWRDEQDYQIPWELSAAEIRRIVDAVGPPYRGAVTTSNGRKLRVLSVSEMPDLKIENRHVGKILLLDEGCAVVICGSGLLKILDAHWEEDAAEQPFYPLQKFRHRFE